MNGEEKEFLEEGMTDLQFEHITLLVQLDELDRMLDYTNDPSAIEYIKARKKALREKMDALFAF